VVWIDYALSNREWRKKVLKPLIASGGYALCFMIPFFYFIWTHNYSSALQNLTVFDAPSQNAGLMNLSKNMRTIFSALFFLNPGQMSDAIGANWGKGQALFLPTTVILFSMGLGEGFAKITQSKILKILILLLFLGLMPAVFSSIYPRRLIATQASYFLLAGLGGWRVLESTKFLLANKFSKIFQTLSLSLLIILLTSVGYRTYIDLCIQARPHQLRILVEEEIVPRLDQEAVFFLSWYHTLSEAVYFFAYNSLEEKIIKNRFRFIRSINHLKKFDQPKDVKRVTFMVRTTPTLADHFSQDLLRKALKTHPQWKIHLKPLPKGSWSKKGTLIILEVPSDDFLPARTFAHEELMPLDHN
jgi:hypothetical protein